MWLFTQLLVVVAAAMTTDEASQWGRIGAHLSWAATKDRTARTAPARAARDAKFLAEADGDPVRAAHLRTAHFRRLAMKSAEVRRAKKAAS